MSLLYSNGYYTDSGLTNFGKALENLPILNSIYLNIDE